MTQHKRDRINHLAPVKKDKDSFSWSLGDVAFSNILERETKPKKKYEKKKKRL